MDPSLQYFQSHMWLFTALVIWSLIWKALALWHSARNNQLAWYIMLIFINTAGILEIIYLLFFRRKRTIF
jgi:methionyl-tRNA synthetase